MQQGYKQTDLGIIPEDWDCVNIEDVATISMCKRIFADQTTENGEIPFYKIGTFGKEPDAYISRTLYDEYRHRFSFPQKGDVLISAAGTLGRTVVYDGKDAYFQDSNIVWLDINKKVLRNEYLNHYYRVIKWASSEGSTIARLYNGIIYATKIALPPLEEQNRIAEALSDVDGMISSLEKLIAKKKAVKQGTMQELLTGRKRLPGFAGEWRIINLGEISKIKTGDKNNEQKSEDGKYPFFVRSQQVERINTYSYDGEAILVPGEGNIGQIFHYVNGKFDWHQRVYKISDFPEFICGKFIYYQMKFSFGEHALKNTVKATVDSLRLPTFENFGILVPPTIEEQNDIASVLSNMDNEIAALEQKLAKARQVKQGMMQQLLTGNIRLI